MTMPRIASAVFRSRHGFACLRPRRTPGEMPVTTWLFWTWQSLPSAPAQLLTMMIDDLRKGNSPLNRTLAARKAETVEDVLRRDGL